jgi:hypothetical protein
MGKKGSFAIQAGICYIYSLAYHWTADLRQTVEDLWRKTQLPYLLSEKANQSTGGTLIVARGMMLNGFRVAPRHGALFHSTIISDDFLTGNLDLPSVVDITANIN